MQAPSQFSRLRCPHPDCPSTFKSQHGRTYHIRVVHINPNSHPVNMEHEQGHDGLDDAHSESTDNANEHGTIQLHQRIEHSHLTGVYNNDLLQPTLNQRLAIPCDANGNYLPAGSPPPPRETPPQGDWTPFESGVQFKLADLFYRQAELSASNINDILDLWAESMSDLGGVSPISTHGEMHALIDSSTLGDVPWKCMVTMPSEDGDAPDWMRTTYEVWYRNPETVVSQMLASPEFGGQFDLRPYIDLDERGKRRWSNVMSGNIAWRRSVSSDFFVSAGDIY